jgi:hypothetical protein
MTSRGEATRPALPGTWLATRRALLPLLVVMVASLLVLFEREWRHGEIFSPADLVFEFFPWAHDAPRTHATNPTRSDEAFYHQPLMASHFARLRNVEWPDLDDTRLSGVPGFFQGLDVGRALSPFSLPFYLLPAEDAVNWYGPLRLLVAALAMWLFLRDLGVGTVGAAAGGVAYGLNGHFLTWLSAPMPTVAAWLPLVLRQVRRCVRRGRWMDMAGLALALGALALGSYMATTLVCLLAAGVYALVELWVARRDAVHATAPVPRATPARAMRALATGGILGLCVGAAALVPMVASLADSPAGARVVSPEGAGWANLATLALPDFWGSPRHGNWWHPDPTANYPEHVAYFGVTVLMLAGLSLRARIGGSLSAIRWCFVALTVVALTRAYGGVPGRWLLVLPGQAQSNPFRWYALAACGLAVLAGLGLHTWLHEPDRRRRLSHLAGPLVVLAGLVAVSAAALLVLMPELQARNLQVFERAQVHRFAIVAGATLLLLGACAWLRDARARAAGGLVLVALAAGDLVHAHRGFNPTVPRHRYYPATSGLSWLRDQASDARIAPVDASADLVEGHVWGMHGLSSVTGFDFHGDTNYQQYLRLAQQPPGQPAPDRPTVWDHVGLRRDTLDLRMLGVLGARFIVASPVDLTPRAGGYATLRPLTDGRTVTLTIPVTHDGLRRLDLLTATYARRNAGYWEWTITDDAGTSIAAGRVDQATLRDNDWWRIEFTPIAESAGRTVTFTLRSVGSSRETSATLLATAVPSPVGATLTVDGRPDPRTVWFRTFSLAPARFGEASLVRAGDLNVYRNPYARPRAWFVREVTVAPGAAHAQAMHAQPFDPAHQAWLSVPPLHQPTTTARITSISLDDDRRIIGVDAPDGGVLIVGERAHAGWSVTVDGRPVPWQLADAVLIGVALPSGTREVVLTYFQPFVRPSLGLTLLALVGIAFASAVSVRRRRN